MLNRFSLAGLTLAMLLGCSDKQTLLTKDAKENEPIKSHIPERRLLAAADRTQPPIVSQTTSRADLDVSAAASRPSDPSAKKNASVEKKTGMPTKQVAGIDVAMLPGYSSAGKNWICLLVSPSITRAELVAVANQLHAENSGSHFQFFDDTAEFKAFVDSDVGYPNSRTPYPEDWAARHWLARLSTMFQDGRLQWELDDTTMPPRFLSQGATDTALRKY